MMDLANRWVNDKGAAYAVVPYEYDDVRPRIILLEPVDGPDPHLRQMAVPREKLEDRQGWRPAPDHGRWATACWFDNGQCEYSCIDCGARCQRSGLIESMPGRNAHTRHYHPSAMRNCSNAAVEEGGYAMQRAQEAAHKTALVPSPAPAEKGVRGDMLSNLLDDPSDARCLDAFRYLGKAVQESLDREMLAVLNQASMKVDPAAPTEKPAAMSPKNYSIASVEISFDAGDGVRRNITGIDPIDYTWKARLDDRAPAHAGDALFQVPGEFRYGVVPPLPFIVWPDLVSRVAEAMKQPYVAPALTPVPVRREVFGGCQWLNYALLADPDPFDMYTRRRIVHPDGSVQEWAPPLPLDRTSEWRDHAQADRMIAAKMLTRDISDKWESLPPVIHGNVVPTFGIDPSCRPTLAGGIISLRRG